MRNLKTAVPAFTIMEVTISMLVAAIVVAMAYSAYGIITRSWLGFTGKNQQMGVVLRLDGLLRRDFEKASFVGQEQGGIVMQGGEQYIHYRFRPEQVVRISGITDTFKVSPSALKGFFEGKELNLNQDVEDDGQTTSLNTGDNAEKQPIDEIAFSIVLQNTTVPFRYKKIYSAESLMAVKP